MNAKGLVDEKESFTQTNDQYIFQSSHRRVLGDVRSALGIRSGV